jgi:hypothetical protein
VRCSSEQFSRRRLARLVVAGLIASTLVAIAPPATSASASAQLGGPAPWWNGRCDSVWWNARAAAVGWHGAGAHPLGASYLGVAVCGPRPGADDAPDILWRRPGWGEQEFECVELAMRFMGEIYGVAAYGANGDNVVRNYRSVYGGGLVKVSNGSVGHAPVPGDVMSFDSPGLGHAAVVASSSVDSSGNGSIRLLSQNDTTDGWRTLAVSHWKVASFGDQVPYGWLHDPKGRGNPGARTTSPGYWMLGADGVVYAFGGVGSFGGGGANASAMAARRDGQGYWIVDRAGVVKGFGTALTYGTPPVLDTGERITTISGTQSGNGYWLFSNRGRAFNYGDARFYGDMRATALNGPVIASVATADGRGYYMVGSDGGIFTFGDAAFHGSTGNLDLNAPIVGIAPTPDGTGYWLVATDGGVFAFNAPFRGSMGSTTLNKPIDGLVAFGKGYLMVASDGGIFSFSDKPFFGSLGDNPPAHPIIGVAVFAP